MGRGRGTIAQLRKERSEQLDIGLLFICQYYASTAEYHDTDESTYVLFKMDFRLI